MKRQTIESMMRIYVACWDAGDRGYDYILTHADCDGCPSLCLHVFMDGKTHLLKQVYIDTDTLEEDLERICTEINGLKG